MLDLTKCDPTPCLPNYFRPTNGKPLPDGFVGSTIVRAGGVPIEGAVEGGGLIIDFIPAGSIDSRRVILGFNEVGMWVENHAEIPDQANLD